MDEKVLITGKISKEMKSVFLLIAALCFLFAIITCFLLTIPHQCKRSFYSSWVGYYKHYTEGIGWSCAFGGGYYDMASYLVIFILGCVFLLAGIVTLILFWAYNKLEISITDHNVKGKTYFGKEVVLPLHMVSSYSTRKFDSTIAVATSSGITKFSFIKNYNDIGNVLSQLINTRNNTANTVATESAPTTAQSTSMDDLVKLKDLLDQGIITQEEFEAKKKQILGL